MKKYITLLFISLSPLLVSAQNLDLKSSAFSDIIKYVIGLINLLIPILFAGAFIFFFWGLSKYVIGAEEKELKQGREYMMWGILAIFILMSYNAVIAIASNELDFGTPNQNGSGSLLPQ